jgi:hypothetical protein
LRGKDVAFLPPESYGGCGDAAEAWAAGVLELDADRSERIAIMIHDGELTEAEALDALKVRVATERVA